MYMFAITATYSHKTADGYTGTRQIPTFYLHPNVQGVLNTGHAVRVARDILTSCVREMPANDTLHIHAIKVTIDN